MSPLYAILDVECVRSAGRQPVDVLQAWLGSGVRLVQLRAKSLPSGEFLSLADEAVLRCRAAGAILIVNDRVDLAAMSGAAGVHVGQDDLPPMEARRLLGQAALIGLSTHTAEQLAAGCEGPVSYLAIGPVFATTTKPSTNAAVGADGVRRATRQAHAAGLPLVAIGGITLDSAPRVLAAGADAVAVISDLLDGDPADRAREYLTKLRKPSSGAGEGSRSFVIGRLRRRKPQ